MPRQCVAKGSYCLVVRLDHCCQIRVGALGWFDFPAGWYMYAGSAQGSGGLQARLARHSRADKRPHWHIDYLLSEGTLETTWQMVSPERLECAWAKAMVELPEARIPARGFGSSDCRCPSHLIYLPYVPNDADIRHVLIQAIYTIGSPIEDEYGQPGAARIECERLAAPA